MKRLIAGLFLLVVPLGSGAQTVDITLEQWSRPRHAEMILRLPGLADLIGALERQPTAQIAVHHAGRDENLLWAEELRSWLIALGVPGERVVLVRGLAAIDRLVLGVREREDTR